ncbi:uncharacterized protein LOC126784444 isoform X2 [Argentina anserina]|uniref:uncharacterized protein LOC126784444 isoform X2 n=1 Tax=Argentina anserina TaxID=57926 RepID=UPI0021763A0A|nr:uncharacterized protein LOC126784444 isoform X2 [Potentilla anserina]
MTTLYPCHLLSTSTHLQVSAKLALYNKPPHSIHGSSKGLAQFSQVHSFCPSVKPSYLLQNSRYSISCAMNMTAGQSDDHGQLKFDQLIAKSRKLWESSPQPVKIFPWKRAGFNFIQLIVDLVLAVVKYLCVPLLAVSSLSEMSYCAQERKLFFVPVPVIIGMAVAEALKVAALNVSPRLKDAEVPWHLFVMTIFFTLLKLPGPYYPFWGRIIIPHIANGGLLWSLWLAFLWYKRPRKGSTAASTHQSESGSQSEPNEL